MFWFKRSDVNNFVYYFLTIFHTILMPFVTSLASQACAKYFCWPGCPWGKTDATWHCTLTSEKKYHLYPDSKSSFSYTSRTQVCTNSTWYDPALISDHVSFSEITSIYKQGQEYSIQWAESVIVIHLSLVLSD